VEDYLCSASTLLGCCLFPLKVNPESEDELLCLNGHRWQVEFRIEFVRLPDVITADTVKEGN
jgi:hypothetical protein